MAKNVGGRAVNLLADTVIAKALRWLLDYGEEAMVS